MQTIKKDGYERDVPKNLGEVIEKGGAAKKSITKSILNNTGIFVGFFLIFIVIVVFTTEINLTSIQFWTQLGLTFFILLFCSYSMYVNCSDSGIKAGRNSEIYNTCKEKYDALRKEVKDNNYLSRLCEFCRYYVDSELMQARTNLLTEVGITYEKYIEKYVGKDKKTLIMDKNLSNSQVKAILKANATKPIRLTPEMILRRGRGSGHRSPLGIKPETKKSINYSTKFLKTCVTSTLTGVIALDVIIEPSWATFAACCLKLLPVVLNGFMGYKMGYENITIDTVNYMYDQSDLMEQLIQYASVTPEPVEKKEKTAKVILEKKLLATEQNIEIENPPNFTNAAINNI